MSSISENRRAGAVQRSWAEALAAPSWTGRLSRLWWRHQLLKVAGICLFVWVFFMAYFTVLRNPLRPVTEMPLTPLDAWVPFEPAAFWAYVSLWFYVGIAPALLPSLRAGLAYAAWAAGLCATGLLCFVLWPTAVPPQVHALDPSWFSHAGLAMLRGVDAAGNACPSLHVATALFTACWVHRILAAIGAPAVLRLLNALWFVLIAWSTVAIRQHVVLDVVAGTVLGAVFAALSRHGGPGPGR